MRVDAVNGKFAVPQVAIEVVLVNRDARQSDEAEEDGGANDCRQGQVLKILS